MSDPLVIAIEAVVHHYWLLLIYGLACAALGALATALCVTAGRADREFEAMHRREAARRALG
jgi:hypothetical protein